MQRRKKGKYHTTCKKETEQNDVLPLKNNFNSNVVLLSLKGNRTIQGFLRTKRVKEKLSPINKKQKILDANSELCILDMSTVNYVFDTSDVIVLLAWHSDHLKNSAHKVTKKKPTPIK